MGWFHEVGLGCGLSFVFVREPVGALGAPS